MSVKDESPQCCEGGLVEWRDQADSFYGPEKAGWVIMLPGEMYGDAFYVNVSFCPFCGARLPDECEVEKANEST